MAPTVQVLIVDDDVDIRESLAEVLEYLGFSTISAANGREALQLLRTAAQPPSIILLDLMMPIMDGYEFLEERAKDPELEAIPVALLTAGRRVDESRPGSNAPFVPKPIDLPLLVRLIHELTGHAHDASPP